MRFFIFISFVLLSLPYVAQSELASGQGNATNSNQGLSNFVECQPTRWQSWQEVNGQISCFLWSCEGITGEIALGPSDLEVRGQFEHIDERSSGTIYESREMLRHLVVGGLFQERGMKFDVVVETLNWVIFPGGLSVDMSVDFRNVRSIFIPDGMASYNQDGQCEGPFDRVVSASAFNP